MIKKVNGWKEKFAKPNQLKSTDLFDLEIMNEKGDLVIAKDCTYNTITNEFTHVDTKAIHHRLDAHVLQWKNKS